MKKLSLFLLLTAFMMTVVSCDKSDNNDDNNPITLASSFSAKINGNLYTGKTLVATRTNNATTIVATAEDVNDQFDLKFNGITTGTYACDEQNVCVGIIDDVMFSTMMNPVGQIVITKYDEAKKVVSGTFSFEGKDDNNNVYSVTEGKFENIPLFITK